MGEARHRRRRADLPLQRLDDGAEGPQDLDHQRAALGLWGIAIFFLFSLYNPSNLVVDKMYWWYVVHLWVEGVWELVMAAVLAYLMLKMTGVDREVIDKWLYVIVGLGAFQRTAGHGSPLLLDRHAGLLAVDRFDLLEPGSPPFFAWYCSRSRWFGSAAVSTRTMPLCYGALAAPMLAFFGAGVWGFMHTLHGVNYYTHGTQVTAAHGHLAFFGAYVCLNLAIISYAMPIMRNREPYNQVLNMVSFWLMSGGMAFMTFTLTFAGVVQTHLQRVKGEGYMDVQDQLVLFYQMRLFAGVLVVIGALLYLYAVFVPRKSEVIAPSCDAARRVTTETREGGYRPLASLLDVSRAHLICFEDDAMNAMPKSRHRRPLPSPITARPAMRSAYSRPPTG